MQILDDIMWAWGTDAPPAWIAELDQALESDPHHAGTGDIDALRLTLQLMSTPFIVVLFPILIGTYIDYRSQYRRIKQGKPLLP